MNKIISKRYLFAVSLIIMLSGCKSHVLEKQGDRQDHYPTLQNTQTLLFIHGMYLTSESWEAWQAYFEAEGFTTVAPDWPLHELSVTELNALHPDPILGELQLSDVVDHYREALAQLEEKPIAIGHSMGGLIAQILLEENLIAGAIALNSAPPFGVISVEPQFLKANWPMLNPIHSASTPIQMGFEHFQYAFANGMELEAQQAAYDQFMVPESRRVGRATTTSAAKINTDVSRGPLLIISGGIDRTITPSLNYTNFQIYDNSPAITDYKQFPNRNHWTTGDTGWQTVAAYSLDWIEQNR